MFNENKNISELRVIKTARNEKEINNAVKKGFFPLLKKVEPSEEIRSKYAVLQNTDTGEIKVSGDFRDTFEENNDTIRVQAIIETWGKIWEYFSDENSQYKRVYKTDFEYYKNQSEIEIYISIE